MFGGTTVWISKSYFWTGTTNRNRPGVEIPKPGRYTATGHPYGHGTSGPTGAASGAHANLLPGFSDSIYGFRPGRMAHQAAQKKREYIAVGKRFVVDMDLKKFFDRVTHDVLMVCVGRKVEDKRVLGLILRFLQAGLMSSGLFEVRS